MNRREFFLILQVCITIFLVGVFGITIKEYIEISNAHNQLQSRHNSLLADHILLSLTLDRHLENKVIPSIMDLENWLQDDQTDAESFSDPDFICTDFAGMLTIHARTQGYDMGIVWVNGTYNSTNEIFHHAINAIETSEGLVYVEPQTDEVWWCNEHQEMSEGKIYVFPIHPNISMYVEEITVVLKY
jgi:hypothetical protein